MGDELILAVDPGSRKIGLGIVSGGRPLAAHQINAPQSRPAWDRIHCLCEKVRAISSRWPDARRVIEVPDCNRPASAQTTIPLAAAYGALRSTLEHHGPVVGIPAGKWTKGKSKAKRLDTARLVYRQWLGDDPGEDCLTAVDLADWWERLANQLGEAEALRYIGEKVRRPAAATAEAYI